MQFTGTLLYNLEHHNRRVDICLEWIFAASSFKWFDPFSITLLNNHPEWVGEITIFELLFLVEESKSLTVDVVVNLITSYISVYSILLFPFTECMSQCHFMSSTIVFGTGFFGGSLRKTHLLQCRIQHMATDEVNIVFNISSQTNPVSPPSKRKVSGTLKLILFNWMHIISNYWHWKRWECSHFRRHKVVKTKFPPLHHTLTQCVHNTRVYSSTLDWILFSLSISLTSPFSIEKPNWQMQSGYSGERF